MSRAVISAIGADRPGLVSGVTGIVRDLGLNVEDSRMTVLGSQFALLMSVTGDDATLVTLEDELSQRLPALGLTHLFRLAPERAARTPSRPMTVSVTAMDHPGIVHEIAEFLSSRGINIEDLNTETEPAPHTGTPIFSLTMHIEVPAGLRVAELREAFSAYCVERDLDGYVESRR